MMENKFPINPIPIIAASIAATVNIKDISDIFKIYLFVYLNFLILYYFFFLINKNNAISPSIL